MTRKEFLMSAIGPLLLAFISYGVASSYEKEGMETSRLAVSLEDLNAKADAAYKDHRTAYVQAKGLGAKLSDFSDQIEELELGLTQLQEDFDARLAGRTVCRRGADGEPSLPCQPRSTSELKNAISHVSAILAKKQKESLLLSGQLAMANQKADEVAQAARSASDMAATTLSRQRWYGRLPAEELSLEEGIAAIQTTAKDNLAKAKLCSNIGTAGLGLSGFMVVLGFMVGKRRKP